MVEHRADNAGVSGSIPLGPTINSLTLIERVERREEKVVKNTFNF